MQIKTFKIPLGDSGETEDELNKFLRSHRVLKVERAFCLEGSGYLAVCIEYMENTSSSDGNNSGGKNRKDYTKDLSETELKRFELFKQKRREIATDKQLPAYMIFTDAELVRLVKQKQLDYENIMSIPEINKNRLKDFGVYFIELQLEKNEEGGQSDASGTPF